MEYLLGSAVTLVTLLSIGYLLRRYVATKDSVSIQYSQSSVYEMLHPFYSIFMAQEVVTLNSQSIEHFKSRYTQVVITKDKAYWIKDNTFLVAPINEDGEIDRESASAVDTMSMSKVQLEEIALIVEELTRGNGYDSRSTGES